MTIISVNGVLSTTETRQIPIPVDSSVRRLLVSSSVASPQMATLRTPSGVAIVSGMPGAVVTDLAQGRVFTVENPVVGTWTITVTGLGFGGDFSMIPDGETNSWQDQFTEGQPARCRRSLLRMRHRQRCGDRVAGLPRGRGVTATCLASNQRSPGRHRASAPASCSVGAMASISVLQTEDDGS